MLAIVVVVVVAIAVVKWQKITMQKSDQKS